MSGERAAVAEVLRRADALAAALDRVIALAESMFPPRKEGGDDARHGE